MTDEKTQQLENRIEKLESTIEKMMPSMRDALKMGGAALVGGAAMSGTASAGSKQIGTIGDKDATPPKLVDLHSEDINNADTVTTDTLDSTTVDNSGTVTTQDLVVNGTATGPFGDLNYELVDTIDSTISANSTKSLSVTGNHHQFLLIFNFNGNGNGDATFLRFNGQSTSDYSFNIFDSNGIQGSTGQDKIFFIQQQGIKSHVGSYLLSDLGHISISGTGFATPEFDRDSLLNGVLNKNIGDLTSVDVLAGPSRIELSGDAKIELFGRI